MNLVYSTLTHGMNPVRLAEFDASIAPPDKQDQARAKMNEQSMQQLGGFGLGPPPKKKAGPS